MTEDTQKKQEKVRIAVEKYKELSEIPKIVFGKASQEMFYYEEACEFFRKPIVDEILKKARLENQKVRRDNLDFFGDCFMYATIVFITEKLKEPVFNYFEDENFNMHLEGAYLENVDFSNCKLNRSRFDYALLNNVTFKESKLIFSCFSCAQLYNVKFVNSSLLIADFTKTKFKVFPLEESCSCFKECNNITHAVFTEVEANDLLFENVNISGGKLENASFATCKFKKVDFCNVSINENTRFVSNCKFDSKVNFKNVDLSCLKDKELISMFTYSIKRFNWEKKLSEGYFLDKEMTEKCKKLDENESENDIKQNKRRRLRKKTRNFPAKVFWYCSDYGYSTKRIIYSFFGVSVFFAVIYWLMGLIDSIWLKDDSCWGCVKHLFQGETFEFLPWGLHGIFRTLYFSFVTMTTLGFGDIYADPSSLLGYVLLSCQVIMGYVLLGILITRVSVLFTSNEISEVPPLAEDHKKEDSQIKKILIWGALAVIALLGWANYLYAFLTRT